ncbi:MAG: hypothetical protein GY938_13600 [Ketobacter sp.]|nr:hypothetical protein [Ketobacter sp.]
MPTRIGDDLFCYGASTGGTEFTVTAPTGANKLIVTLHAYEGSASTGNTTVRWGNGTTWQSFSAVAAGSVAGGDGGQLLETFELDSPVDTYTKIEINSTVAHDEGMSCTFAAFSNAGAIIDATVKFNQVTPGSGVISDTVTGGSNGDTVYIGGHSYNNDISFAYASQTLIELQNTTMCNTQKWGHAEKDWVDGGTGSASVRYGGIVVVLIAHQAASDPTITDVDSDEIVSQGQTSVTITGTNFEATKGTGSVKIAKTDNIADSNVVTQTTTSWADTSIDFTANFPVDVAEGEGCYLFVTNDTGDSNASGFAITREDITAPTLTSPTGDQTGQTTATGNVTTNEATGTVYRYTSTSATPPSVANHKTGSGSVASANQTVTVTGLQTMAGITGLTASTSYYNHYLHTDAASNDSTQVTSAQFTTASPVSFATSDGLVNNTGTLLTSTAVSWTWLPLGRIGSVNGITALDGTGTTHATTGVLTVTGMSAGAGVLWVADLVTDATDDLVYYEAGTAA